MGQQIEKYAPALKSSQKSSSSLHLKRSLSQDVSKKHKKFKLCQSAGNDSIEPVVEPKDETKTLITFAKFMKSKKFNKKLTMSDLEQFCIQKICETILYHTDTGKMHRHIRKQSIINLALRKEIKRLWKQVRDLTVVHQMLINDFRQNNEEKKPLVPLKIVRSVGLQVNLLHTNQNSQDSTAIFEASNYSTPSTPVHHSRPTTPVNNTAMSQATNPPVSPSSPTRDQKQVLEIPVTLPVVNQQPMNVEAVEPPKQPKQDSTANLIVVNDEYDATTKTNVTPVLNQIAELKSILLTTLAPIQESIRVEPVQPPKQTSQGDGVNVIVVNDETVNTDAVTPSLTVSQSTPTCTSLHKQVPEIAPLPESVPVVNQQPVKPPKQSNKGSSANMIVVNDEDKTARMNTSTPMKILHKKLPIMANPNVTDKKTNKAIDGPAEGSATLSKTVQTSVKEVTPAKNAAIVSQSGVTVPTRVVTRKPAGGVQLLHVRPSQLVRNMKDGRQEVMLLNFQPGNNLTSTQNDLAIPTKETITETPALQKHPAALPSLPYTPNNSLLKPVLPKPHLNLRKTNAGAVLEWQMPYNLDLYEGIACYELYAYQETHLPPSNELWKKVGVVKALPLPIQCTLHGFMNKKTKFYFSVRSIDVHQRIGAFSDPKEIHF